MLEVAVTAGALVRIFTSTGPRTSSSNSSRSTLVSVVALAHGQALVLVQGAVLGLGPVRVPVLDRRRRFRGGLGRAPLFVSIFVCLSVCLARSL